MSLRPTIRPASQKNHSRPPFAHVIFLTLAMVAAALILTALPNAAFAQGNPGNQSELKPAAFSPERFPPSLRGKVSALGDRLHTPGKERLILSGTLTDDQGTNSVQLIYEVPGKFQLQRQAGQGGTLTFNGRSAQALAGGQLDQRDEDLLESLSADSPDLFFADLLSERQTAMRLLGRRFRGDDGTAPNYQGPWFDVYELVRPIKTRRNVVQQQKMYFFDSDTGLLARVRYRQASVSGPRIVDTHFENWTTAAGLSFPSRIRRVENGSQAFSLEVTGANVTARVPDGTFETP